MNGLSTTLCYPRILVKTLCNLTNSKENVMDVVSFGVLACRAVRLVLTREAHCVSNVRVSGPGDAMPGLDITWLKA